MATSALYAFSDFERVQQERQPYLSVKGPPLELHNSTV